MRVAKRLDAIGGALVLMLAPLGFVAGAPASRAPEPCEYRTVHVDPSIADASAGGREIAEPMRVEILRLAAEALPGFGLRVVPRSEGAYWTLSASSLVGATSVGVFIELSGSVELQHHLYIAELDGRGFPYRGEVGGNHYIDILPQTEPEQYRSAVERGVGLLWELDAPQVAALCAMSARLRDEGWVDIRELRLELIEELQRARRERANQTRSKRLELEVQEERPAADPN